MTNKRKRGRLIALGLITPLLIGIATLWSFERAQAGPPPAPCPPGLLDC